MEDIKKIIVMDDGTVFIKTNKREHQRKMRKNINDEEYFLFQNKEYFKKRDLQYYDVEFKY